MKANCNVRIFTRVEGTKIHTQLLSLVNASDETYEITDVRGANGVSILLTSLVGARLWVQLDAIDSDGTRSAGSNVASVVIA